MVSQCVLYKSVSCNLAWWSTTVLFNLIRCPSWTPWPGSPVVTVQCWVGGLNRHLCSLTLFENIPLALHGSPLGYGALGRMSKCPYGKSGLIKWICVRCKIFKISISSEITPSSIRFFKLMLIGLNCAAYFPYYNMYTTFCCHVMLTESSSLTNTNNLKTLIYFLVNHHISNRPEIIWVHY